MNYSGWIITIGAVSLIILSGVFYFLYANRGSEGVLTVSFQVLGAVLAAAALLTIALSKPSEKMCYQTNFLMFTNSDGELLNLKPIFIAINLSPYHAYSIIDHISIFTEYSPKENSTRSDDVFDELLTAAFLQWLASHYNIHWQMEHFYVAGISGGVSNGTQIDNRDEECATYYFSDSSNGFLVNIRYFNQIKLPKGSKVYIESEGPKTTVTISNRYMTFTFEALYLGSAGISYSNLGDMIDSHLQVPDSYFTRNYSISIQAEFHRSFQWSPETNRQRAWMQQVFRNFERDFSWDSFQPQFQQAFESLEDSIYLNGMSFRISNEE